MASRDALGGCEGVRSDNACRQQASARGSAPLRTLLKSGGDIFSSEKNEDEAKYCFVFICVHKRVGQTRGLPYAFVRITIVIYADVRLLLRRWQDQ